MSNLVPFNQMQAPAHLAQLQLSPDLVKQMNAAAALGTGGGGVPKISLKGGHFRLQVQGAETVLPTRAVQIALLRVNDGINKTWYSTPWKEGEEPVQPDCSSDDGIAPRIDSPKRQSEFCETCPHNQWGSGVNPTTGKKTKSCSDTKRLALVPPGPNGRFVTPDETAYQLAIPPASLSDFGGFVRQLSAGSVKAAYNMVVVEIAFDTTVSYPKLNFRAVRWLELDEYTVVAARYDDVEVMRIAGLAEYQGRPVGHAQVGVAQVAHQPQQAPVQQAYQQPVQQQPQQNFAQPQQQPNVGWPQPQQQPVQHQQPQQQPVHQQPQQNFAQPEANAGWPQPQQNFAQPQQQPVHQQPQQNFAQPEANAGWPQPQQNFAQPQQQPVHQQPQQNFAQPSQDFTQPQQNFAQPQQNFAQPQQQPVHHQQPQQNFAQPQQPVQQQPQQPQQPQPQPEQQAQPRLMAGGREYGKPAAGKTRRNAQEIAEDKAADEASAGGGQGSNAPQTFAQPQQNNAPQTFAQPQQAFDPAQPFAGAQQEAPTGAPNQPGVVESADIGGALAGWDDPV
jgi:hypothetical protein